MRPVIALSLILLLVIVGAAVGLLEHSYRGLRIAGNITDIILGTYLALFGFRVVHTTIGRGESPGSRIETWRGFCKVIGPLFIVLGLLGLIGM